MDEAVKTILLTLALLLPGAVHAAGSLAPFDPPAAREIASVATGSGVGGGAVAAPVVQGLRTGLQPAALIAGRWTKPGETVSGGLVVAVLADGVIWRGADGLKRRLQPMRGPVAADRPKENP